MTRHPSLAAAWLAALSPLACSSFSTNSTSRTEVITALVEDVYVPAHDDLARATADLAASAALCSDTAARLGAAQIAWKDAQTTFGRTAAFAFGPALDDRHTAALFFWPTRPELVDEAVAGTATIDAAFVEALGAAAKGLPAIEAQIFDPLGGDARVIAALSTEPDAARRCALVGELAANASTRADALRTAWIEPGGDYGGELVRAGTTDSRYDRVQAALDEVLNGPIAALQVIDDVDLAAPMGSKTGGTPQPQLVPSPFANASMELVRAQLSSVAAVWFGAPSGAAADPAVSLGLRRLVLSRSPTLPDEVDAALAAADEALAAITVPLAVAVVDDPARVQTAIDRVKDVRRLFTADVPQQLDGTVTLSDNDGD
jgi:predicted lipoprotein